MASTKVRDVMTEDVKTVRPDDSVAEVYDLMDSEHFRHVPVVEDDELVGIISSRDLFKTMLGGGNDLPVSAQRQMLERISAAEIMNTSPETIESSATLREAGETIIEFKLGCLPVVEGNQLVGIITESDFVRMIVEQER